MGHIRSIEELEGIGTSRRVSLEVRNKYLESDQTWSLVLDGGGEYVDLVATDEDGDEWYVVRIRLTHRAPLELHTNIGGDIGLDLDDGDAVETAVG